MLADIHGNAWALEAVLADAKRRGVTEFLDLGDVLYGPLAPRRTYELMTGVKIAAQVRGNQDRFILDGTGNPTLDWVRADLGPEPVAWLNSLPAVATHGDWLLCHGSPSSDVTYLLENVASGHARPRPDVEIQCLLGPTQAAWILCGHTHLPRLVRLVSGQQVMNPGSVGLPAYDDTVPVPHAMESLSPHARYATIEDGAVSFHSIAYDWDAAAARARQLGREDWARGLESGRMS